MSAGFDWLQVEFRRIFPQTFVLLSFHECARHLQETYSKACRYIVGYLHVERWKMDGSSFPPPLFSPPEEGCVEIFAHCPFFLFLSFHPFSKSASSCFSSPPLPLEVKLLGNWKMRDVEIFGGKLVHCFVTIRVVDPWRDKNNVFIWKNCLFEIIIIKD